MADPVASETPKPLSTSVIFMWCGWLGSPRKFTNPTARTIPLAHDSGFPLVNGDGRLRASTPASRRHSSAYSASRCFLQKASVRATIRSCASLAFEGAAPLDLLLGAPAAFARVAWPLKTDGAAKAAPETNTALAAIANILKFCIIVIPGLEKSTTGR